MAEFAELLDRIDELSARAARPGADPALLAEIEDLLAEGYMQALTQEARSRRLGSRLENLVETLDEPGAAVEARRLVVQRRTLDESVRTLRDRLNAIRHLFVLLGGGQSVRS